MILSMAAFALAASISPGPVNLICLSCGTRYSLSKGLAFVTGATLGFIVLFISIGAGLYSMLSIVPGFSLTLRWGGIAFLLFLGIQLLRESVHSLENTSSKAPSFITGISMQWLNPKAWIASVSGIGVYTNNGNLYDIIVFSAVYIPICWLSLASWVYAGTFLTRYLLKPSVVTTINRILGILLIFSCLYFSFNQEF